MTTIVVPDHRSAVMEILSIGGFRRLWLSNGFTFMGLRVQEMALAWLVLEITGVNMWAGIVNGLPVITVIIFSLTGGGTVVFYRMAKMENERFHLSTSYTRDYVENYFIEKYPNSGWTPILQTLVPVGDQDR